MFPQLQSALFKIVDFEKELDVIALSCGVRFNQQSFRADQIFVRKQRLVDLPGIENQNLTI